MVASVGAARDTDYYTKSVAGGRENYYTKVSGVTEPPGMWRGRGAAQYGLSGEINPDEFEAIFGERRLDPREPEFADRDQWDVCKKLGATPRQYRSADDRLAERIIEEGFLTDAQVTELRSASVAEARGSRSPADRILVAKLTESAGVTGDRIGQLRAEVGTGRSAVTAIDVTYSPPKSFTLLRTALQRRAEECRRAGDLDRAAEYTARDEQLRACLWKANDLMLDKIEDEVIYTRGGRHTAHSGHWVDVTKDGLIVGSFEQHNSRSGDPQGHIHNVIRATVVDDDGAERQIDSRMIHQAKKSFGTLADAELVRATAEELGLTWKMREDGVGWEVEGVDQAVMDLFSAGAARVNRAMSEKIARYQARFGRAPSRFEVDQMRRTSNLRTRPSKQSDGETNDEEMDRWAEKASGTVAGGLSSIAVNVKFGQRQGDGSFSPSAVKAAAVEAVQQVSSAWRVSDLERELGLRLPTVGVSAAGRRVMVETLRDEVLADESAVVPVRAGRPTDEVLPETLKLRNGRSRYEAPGGQRYVSVGHLRAEQELRDAAVVRGRYAVSGQAADQWLDRHGPRMGLDEAQRATIRGLLTSGAATSVLIGPAGAGKSFTLGGARAAWEQLAGGRIVALAKSEAATEVLRGEGLTAKNIDQFILAHKRMAERRAEGKLPHSKDAEWDVTARDIVVIDEASFASTEDIVKVRAIVESAGGRMVQAGDPAQMGAPGAGGVFSMLSRTTGAEVYTLSQVHRFKEANPWEGKASLRLRDGDPGVVSEYVEHGRLPDAGTLEQALDAAAKAYVAERLAGRDSLIVVGSNDLAADASNRVRDALVELGVVQPDGVPLRDGTTAAVGDIVAARHNDWQLGVTNRHQYRVDEVREDGSLTLTAMNGSGTREVPASYVATDVTLAYSATVHAAEGRTIQGQVDAIITPGMSRNAMYTSLTRSRTRNVGRVVTDSGDGQPPTTVDAVVRDILGQEVDTDETALEQAERYLRDTNNMQAIHAEHEAAVRIVCDARTRDWLDDLAADGVITSADRARFDTETQPTGQLARLLRVAEQADHDPEQVLRAALENRPLDGLASVAAGVQARIRDTLSDDLRPAADRMTYSIPDGASPAMAKYISMCGRLADNRRRDLGTEVAADPPEWAIKHLGDVPDDPMARLEWETRAGIIAGHREAHPSEHQSEAMPLGRAPGFSDTEARASYQAAWVAAGMPESSADERLMSDGALINRYTAWERAQKWAPKYVRDDLARVTEQRVDHEQAAVRAEAAGDTEAAERARLDAQVLADKETALRDAADTYRSWLADHAATETIATKARDELRQRGVAPGQEGDRVTAAEWEAEHRTAMVAEDPHREVHEVDVAEPEREAADVWGRTAQDVDDTAVADQQETAAVDVPTEPAARENRTDTAEPARVSEGPTADAAAAEPRYDEHDVPGAAEVAATVTRAELWAAELADRESQYAAREAAESTARAEAEEIARTEAQRAEDVEAARPVEQTEAETLRL